MIFLQLIGEEDPDILFYDLDGNTIAHLVAAGGNTEVFKVHIHTDIEVNMQRVNGQANID